ncbi:MAG: cytochrome c oxidase subunit 3 [Bacteriovorax sp.]|nr:cytochrome c oxidase subunit 3 [Bacteriovorax sp.]
MATATKETLTSEKNQGQEIISSVAMIVTLVSFSMLFATLMMGFAMFRLTAPVWPPAGMMRPSLLLPSLSTLCIFISSLSFLWFEKDISNKKGLILTTVLGLAFMSIQFLLWHGLKTQGIFVSSGIFPSIIYAFTWIHAAHIVAALGLLFWLLFRVQKDLSPKTQLFAANVGKFWHFLGIVWFIMFVTIFVL